MNKAVIIEKTKELVALNVCEEAKAAGNALLEAVGTAKEDEAIAALIAELKEDIVPIDGLLEFAGSDFAKEMFGEEKAAELVAHTKERKAAGEQWCDCPGCTKAMEIVAEA